MPPAPEQGPPLEQVLGSAAVLEVSRVEGDGPAGRLPLTPDMLRNEPSGNIFGLTQNAGMGWRTDALGGPQYVIVSTMGGLRSEQLQARLMTTAEPPDPAEVERFCADARQRFAAGRTEPGAPRAP